MAHLSRHPQTHTLPRTGASCGAHVRAVNRRSKADVTKSIVHPTRQPPLVPTSVRGKI